MNIFYETAGIEAGIVPAFLTWLLCASVIIFAVTAMVGMYTEATHSRMEWIDIIVKVAILTALVTGVGILV
ncbi:hypothetical protein PSECIP111951_04150 [Pseudoalteromonas holothuriae]|uniref:Uncharacterized protein n=1 Tax=Pseudoalteromonas holothuriae TaxID=2963714 RepID=A0ABN8UUB9_9GAMM|nr:hypothetical protein [Pseudoalteromonas sp. CIP111951]CAH9068442.1 hypothetical protein PSECIP111951_04150 [Pseudoalteromonas sp. CIP111951]